MKYTKLGIVSGFSLALSLSGCGAPKYFVIKGYPGDEQPGEQTFTVQSVAVNFRMFLLGLDGKGGKFVPFAAGPGAYAGFDLKLLPGKHQLKVHCSSVMYGGGSITSEPILVDIDGAPGETYQMVCQYDGRRINVDVDRQ